jgi:hypothetical protein
MVPAGPDVGLREIVAGLLVTVNCALADAYVLAAVTVYVPGAAAGTVKLVLIEPVDVVEVVAIGAPLKKIVTGTEPEGLNPVPVTVTTVPVGPVLGLSVSVAAALAPPGCRKRRPSATMSVATRERMIPARNMDVLLRDIGKPGETSRLLCRQPSFP